MSAHVGDNADIFPEILQLHVPVGARIADVTFGGGIFWKKVNLDLYDLTPSDIASGVDCRSLPCESEAFNCVVLDPPYMEGLFRRDGSHLAVQGSHAALRRSYSNGQGTVGGPKAVPD